MNNKINKKYYELEFIDGIIRRITYRGRQGSIYNFKYDNLKRVRKLIDISNGVYFVNKDDETMDIYIGQTTNGLFRFTEHKMKEYKDTAEIYFYAFEGQTPNKNLLDYIESKMIELANNSSYNLLNSTKGNKKNIRAIDNQYAEENIPTILSILKVFGIEFLLKTNESGEMENLIEDSKKRKFKMISDINDDFFDANKEKNYDYKISRFEGLWILREGSKVAGRTRWEEFNDSNYEGSYFYEAFIKHVNEEGIVTKDIVWKSISPLVAFAKGTLTASGWELVKNKNGKTPDEVYRR